MIEPLLALGDQFALKVVRFGTSHPELLSKMADSDPDTGTWDKIGTIATIGVLIMIFGSPLWVYLLNEGLGDKNDKG